MIDTVRLPSKRVAAFGVTVVILLVGVFLVVRVTSRPAYEATAEMRLEWRSEVGRSEDAIGNRSPPSPAFIDALNREVLVLESPQVAERAATLLSEADPSLDVDAALIEKNLSTDVHAKRGPIGLVEVRYRADDPHEAREGANAIVEAYRQVRAQDLSPDSTLGLTGGSLAPTPTRRADTLNTADVSRFLLVSILAVYLTWRWWPPNPRRHRPDRLVVGLLVGLLVGLVVGLLVGLWVGRPGFLLVGLFTVVIWLSALAFAIGVWSVCGPFARNFDDKLPSPK